MQPELPPPYADALRAAVDDLLTHYEPFAIIAAGSVLRGQVGISRGRRRCWLRSTNSTHWLECLHAPSTPLPMHQHN